MAASILFRPFTHVPRRPIDFTQAIHDRAMDSVLRISIELNFEGRIEVIDGVQQTDNTRRYQIVKTDVIRQAIVYPACDQTDLGKVGEHQLLTPQCGGGVGTWPRSICRGAHLSLMRLLLMLSATVVPMQR